MEIILVTPAPPGSRAGNRATASRWANFLESKGHTVNIRVSYKRQPADLMIALHAWRSADAIRLFRQRHPATPLLLALTGTDIYKFQLSDPNICYASMDQADLIVGLHALVKEDIPERYWPKLRIVYQSAEPLSEPVNTLRQVTDTEHFTICVVGHLREEKDSLRAAWASRELPDGSTIRIIQAGKAYNDEWRQQAFLEQQNNPRYRWWGEVSQHEVKELMAEARVMVMSSIMEGGANAISEACVAGLPIIASDIAGNRGLLGDDYAGYYPVKDTRALASLMLRAEREPTFLEQLRQHCIARADLFKPEKECAEINKIVDELTRR